MRQVHASSNGCQGSIGMGIWALSLPTLGPGLSVFLLSMRISCACGSFAKPEA